MTRLGSRKAWLVGGAYTYWALFVASWWVWPSSSQNEPWFDAFSGVAEVLFFPLIIVSFGDRRAPRACGDRPSNNENEGADDARDR